MAIKTAAEIDPNGWVNLLPYTSSMYTFPKDGYVQTSAPAGKNVAYYLYSSNGTLFLEITIPCSTVALAYAQPVFVRKGMKYRGAPNYNAAGITFYPLL